MKMEKRCALCVWQSVGWQRHEEHEQQPAAAWGPHLHLALLHEAINDGQAASQASPRHRWWQLSLAPVYRRLGRCVLLLWLLRLRLLLDAPKVAQNAQLGGIGQQGQKLGVHAELRAAWKGRGAAAFAAAAGGGGGGSVEA